MTNLASSTPIAAQKLLNAIATCTEETIWTKSDGGQTYLHPKGKVVFQGLVNPGDKRPDGQKWIGDKPMYLIVYNHPRNKPGMCDAHWFELDVLDVAATVVLERLPECNHQEESEYEVFAGQKLLNFEK